MTMSPIPPARHAVTRVRHELRRRRLTVVAVEAPTPRVRRIHLTSPDLADFKSPSPDDHVKLFFADAFGGTVMRDFTPRAFEPERRVLTIDFALHAAGPATTWAAHARVGDTLDIGGPRGSTVVTDDFDAYLLVGDESALPAIARRVEGLRAGVHVTTIVAIANRDERQELTTAADWRPLWVVRGESGPAEVGEVLWAVEQLLGAGWRLGAARDTYAWVAGETSLVTAVRDRLVAAGQDPAWLQARGYWKRGVAGADEHGGSPRSVA
jgi:NADPH-dependent ferric siderophore reductase